MTTEYFAVYYDEDDTPEEPVGLYRRVYDDSGCRTASEAYHARTGWHLNDYWLRIRRGEPDKHLVPIDEQRAQELQKHFDRMRDERKE